MKNIYHMNLTRADNIKLIRIKQVIQKTGLSKSKIYSRMKMGTFPSSIRLNDHAVAWIEKEVDLWICIHKYLDSWEKQKNERLKEGRLNLTCNRVI